MVQVICAGNWTKSLRLAQRTRGTLAQRVEENRRGWGESAMTRRRLSIRPPYLGGLKLRTWCAKRFDAELNWTQKTRSWRTRWHLQERHVEIIAHTHTKMFSHNTDPARERDNKAHASSTETKASTSIAEKEHHFRNYCQTTQAISWNASQRCVRRQHTVLSRPEIYDCHQSRLSTQNKANLGCYFKVTLNMMFQNHENCGVKNKIVVWNTKLLRITWLLTTVNPSGRNQMSLWAEPKRKRLMPFVGVCIKQF